jgi:hypothetical protein
MTNRIPRTKRAGMVARQQEDTISKREAAKKKAAGPGTAGPAGELLERQEAAFVRR